MKPIHPIPAGILLFSLLAAGLPPREASAKGKVWRELVLKDKGASKLKPRAWLQFKEARQWVDLEYDYEASRSEGGGVTTESSEHNFEERYHFQTLYAFYHHRFLNGRLSFDVGLEQEMFDELGKSGSATGMEFEYELNGVFFQKRWHPVDFFLESGTEQVARRFARSYELKTDAYGASISFQNRILPTRIGFTHSQSETDGLTLDRTQTNDTVSFTTNHRFRDVSHTTLSIFKGSYSSDIPSAGGLAAANDTETETTDIYFSNRLDLGSGRRSVSLDSVVQRSEDTGLNERTVDRWHESLMWRPGKTLRLGAMHSSSSWKAVEREAETVTDRFWISHRLFESFTTDFGFGTKDSRFDTGEEKGRDWDIGFGYRKKLPAQSILTLGYDHEHEVTDRNLESDRIFVFAESLTIDLIDDFLANYDVVESSIVVRSADGLTTYRQGIDYDIQTVGRSTEILILPGGLISAGDTIHVDYEYLVNPSIEYATISDAYSASISLFQGLYRFWGSYLRSGEELLSGGTPGYELVESRMYLLGAETKRGWLTCGALYGDMDSTIEAYRYTEGYLRYLRPVGLSRYSLSLRDRITSYEETGFRGGGTGGTENRLLASAGYRRSLPFRRAHFDLASTYLTASGRGRDRSEFMVETGLEMTVGKTVITLSADTTWEWNRDRNIRTDSAFLRIRRYF